MNTECDAMMISAAVEEAGMMIEDLARRGTDICCAKHFVEVFGMQQSSGDCVSGRSAAVSCDLHEQGWDATGCLQTSSVGGCIFASGENS